MVKEHREVLSYKISLVVVPFTFFSRGSLVGESSRNQLPVVKETPKRLVTRKLVTQELENRV